MPTSPDRHVGRADAATQMILELLKVRLDLPTGSHTPDPANGTGYRSDAGTVRTVLRRVNAAVHAQQLAVTDIVRELIRATTCVDHTEGGPPAATPRGMFGEVEDALKAWEQARLAHEREETRVMSLDSHLALMREQARQSLLVEGLRRRAEAVPGFDLLNLMSLVRFSEEVSPAACLKFRAGLARAGLTGPEARDVSIVDLQTLLGPAVTDLRGVKTGKTRPVQKRPGRPKVELKNPSRYAADLKLYQDYSSSGVSQREFLRRLGRDDINGMRALDRGRKHEAKAAKAPAE